MPFVVDCWVARNLEVFSTSDVTGAKTFWKQLKSILLRTVHDEAEINQMHRDAKLSIQMAPPYKNSVIYTFLKDYPESHTVELLRKVKRHITLTSAQGGAGEINNRKEREYIFLQHRI